MSKVGVYGSGERGDVTKKTVHLLVMVASLLVVGLATMALILRTSPLLARPGCTGALQAVS